MVTVAKAQSSTASLNITLTDVQSVTFNNLALNEVVSENQGNPQSGPLQMLSQSTSQVKKIASNHSEYQRLYKEFYSDKTAVGSRSLEKGSYRIVATNTPNSRAKNMDASNLVIYQIDPR